MSNNRKTNIIDVGKTALKTLAKATALKFTNLGLKLVTKINNKKLIVTKDNFNEVYNSYKNNTSSSKKGKDITMSFLTGLGILSAGLLARKLYLHNKKKQAKKQAKKQEDLIVKAVKKVIKKKK